jgi:C-5 cytosine-specific DNA methylase
MKPVVIDLCCGLGGWSRAFMDEGYNAIGFDIERHEYGDKRYPGELILKDIRELNGYDLKHSVNPAVIVASPPCQKYSYMAMPWGRAKREICWQKWERESPFGNFKLNELFNACFRIAGECGVPIVLENVKGAQPWAGRARWHYGSYYLWGDVPALMPTTLKLKNSGGSWFGMRDGESLERNDPRDMRRDENGEYVNAAAQGRLESSGESAGRAEERRQRLMVRYRITRADADEGESGERGRTAAIAHGGPYGRKRHEGHGRRMVRQALS